jgi:hypothetical protein
MGVGPGPRGLSGFRLDRARQDALRGHDFPPSNDPFEPEANEGDAQLRGRVAERGEAVGAVAITSARSQMNVGPPSTCGGPKGQAPRSSFGVASMIHSQVLGGADGPGSSPAASRRRRCPGASTFR